MTAERVEQRTPSPRLFETGELPPILRDPSVPTPRKPFRPVHFGIKTVLFVFVFYFFILPLIPGFRRAASELIDVQPLLLFFGIGLQVGSWWAYAFLTRAALGDAGHEISADAHVPHRDELQGADLHRARRQRRRLGARLPPADPLGGARCRRRVRHGHRRDRIGRRSQRDAVGRPADLHPDPWRERPLCRSPPSPASSSC